MKNTNRKFKDTTDNRKQWKDEALQEIEYLQDDINLMGLPEDKAKELESLIKKFTERLMDSISLFEVTTEIGIDEECLLENMLDEVYFGRAVANDDETNRMISIVEEKGFFIKAESLAEQMKVESFLDELAENPYQLKLIA